MRRLDLFTNDPFMRGWAEVMEDGTVFTKVRTGEAASALPFVVQDGKCDVILLEQVRPELSDQRVLKAVGGYQKEGESPEDCAKRNLFDKLGLNAGRLCGVSLTVGYSVVDVPIFLYLFEGYERVREPATGCGLRLMPLSQAVVYASHGKFGDDATSLLVQRLAIILMSDRDLKLVY